MLILHNPAMSTAFVQVIYALFDFAAESVTVRQGLSMKKLSAFYEAVFGCKAYKLSLHAGCTCPNRDGTKGKGGCIFCSGDGSGDFVPAHTLPVAAQIAEAKQRIEAKLRGRSGTRRGVYIAYFQSFSATYGDTQRLTALFTEALSQDGVCGLAVATRPDCLKDDMIAYLAALSERTFVQVELGLQTSNEATGCIINRCYTNTDYKSAVRRLQEASPHIHIVTHVIFGLPGDSERDMLETVRFVADCAAPQATQSPKSRPWGIKITALYVLKGTRLSELYAEGAFKTLEKAEYYALLKKALLLLPPDCVVHRLTGDPPKRTLIAPLWPQDKKRVLNEINALTQPLLQVAPTV